MKDDYSAVFRNTGRTQRTFDFGREFYSSQKPRGAGRLIGKLLLIVIFIGLIVSYISWMAS